MTKTIALLAASAGLSLLAADIAKAQPVEDFKTANSSMSKANEEDESGKPPRIGAENFNSSRSNVSHERDTTGDATPPPPAARQGEGTAVGGVRANAVNVNSVRSNKSTAREAEGVQGEVKQGKSHNTTRSNTGTID